MLGGCFLVGPSHFFSSPIPDFVFKFVTCLYSLLQILRSDLNSKVFEDLLAFVGRSRERTQHQGAIREIPAAALITGWSSALNSE